MLAFAPCAHSQDKRIKKSDLPPAVQRTAAQQSAGATVRGYAQETENGKLEYEIEMTVNGHSKDVNIDHDGNVLEIEEGVTLGDLRRRFARACKSRRQRAKSRKSNPSASRTSSSRTRRIS